MEAILRGSMLMTTFIKITNNWQHASAFSIKDGINNAGGVIF